MGNVQTLRSGMLREVQGGRRYRFFNRTRRSV
jgi:hypothetical protein